VTSACCLVTKEYLSIVAIIYTLLPRGAKNHLWDLQDVQDLRFTQRFIVKIYAKRNIFDSKIIIVSLF